MPDWKTPISGSRSSLAEMSPDTEAPLIGEEASENGIR